ncbi:MAG: hypothetical protein NVSMB56_14640 [Pyrinomonadaceae bacterium]
MSQTIKAVYHNGVFVPQVPCDLPENTEVEVKVQPSNVEMPSVTDPQERKRILAELVERMRANSLPENAPRFTQDELHERR